VDVYFEIFFRSLLMMSLHSGIYWMKGD
jgi:hypothetical protein